ncbi:MAG: hypothetical protein A2Y17_08130 [Clostridiales bacterium GWF2_38_85]|nr:MAG: hypothetical protein A2Y17_08130 [Clostridiales bacterium GWF2_38_85]HBL83840.1 hypothetical protein [Clostridiales bacterium]
MNELLKRFNIKFFADNMHITVFVIFMLIQTVTLQFVVLFGDDYYYGSFLKDGLGSFISENVVHYTQTNGRAFVHLLDELLLAGGSIFLWRLFNLVVIGVVVYFTAAVSAKKFIPNSDSAVFRKSLIISCALFGLLELAILRQSVYWATGAMNYLFPYAMFIAFYYFYRKDIETKAFDTRLWLLAFLACFTSEQSGFVAIATAVYMMVVYAFKYKTHPHSQYYVNLIAAGAGFALQIFAPGNSVRQSLYPEFYSKSIFGQVIENGKPLYNIIFNIDGLYIYILLAFLCFAFVLLNSAKDRKIKAKITLYALTAVALYSIYIYSYALIYNHLILTELAFLPSFAYGIIGFGVVCIIEAFREKDFELPFFVLMTPSMQLAMLISPQYGTRTVLISALLLFVPLIKFILEFINDTAFAAISIVLLFAFTDARYPVLFVVVAIAFIASKYKLFSGKQPAKYAAVILLVCISFSGMLRTLEGYYRNYSGHVYNREAVEQFKENPPDNKTLTLVYLESPDYKYTMPYDDPYHMEWYKVINNLPTDTVIVFVEYKNRP